MSIGNALVFIAVLVLVAFKDATQIDDRLFGLLVFLGFFLLAASDKPEK